MAIDGLMTVALDFDAVICASAPGEADISGRGPVPGALESLKFLLGRYAVFVLTARDVKEVIPWLEGYGFRTDTDNGDPTWTVRDVLLVTNRKLPADVYVDDKAVRFWSWNTCMSDIERLAQREM